MNTSIWNDIRQIFRQNDNAVFQIIIINVFIFLAIGLFRLVVFLFNLDVAIDAQTSVPAAVLQWLAVPADVVRLIQKPWTVITYMFLHGGIFHILFNMLWLYWLGNILREYLGNRKIFPVYLLGGIFGAMLYIIAFNIFPVFQSVISASFSLGASAGVLAIVVATATLLPDYTIFLLFFGPVKLKYLALVSILLDAISIPSGNAGGHIAHLGGALFGFLFIRQLKVGNDWSKPVNAFFDFVAGIFKRKSKPRVVHKQEIFSNKKRKQTHSPDKQAKIDAILDKIAQSGYESLSSEEKEFLFRASKED